MIVFTPIFCNNMQLYFDLYYWVLGAKIKYVLLYEMNFKLFKLSILNNLSFTSIISLLLDIILISFLEFSNMSIFSGISDFSFLLVLSSLKFQILSLFV